MTASLYQSGSIGVFPDPSAIRLTLDARNVTRNLCHLVARKALDELACAAKTPDYVSALDFCLTRFAKYMGRSEPILLTRRKPRKRVGVAKSRLRQVTIAPALEPGAP